MKNPQSMPNKPLVSIGIPTYSRSESLYKALESMVNQTYENIEILVSDNASPDNKTEKVVNKFAKKDKRIVFFKQDQNIGLEGNFFFVLEKAKGKYFTWAADDDTRSFDFLEKNVNFLEKHNDYIASTSKVRFKGSDFDEYKMGDGPLSDHMPENRIIKFLETWHANGRLFSLIRRKELLVSYKNIGPVLASDWIVILRLASIGKFNRMDQGELILGHSGTSSNSSIFSIYRDKLIGWILPFLALNNESYKLLKNSGINFKIKLFVRLMKLNFTAFVWQAKFELFQIYKKFK